MAAKTKKPSNSASAQANLNSLSQQENAAASGTLGGGGATVNGFTPVNQLTPQSNPSAWGITNPNATLYVGDTAPGPLMGPYSTGQIVGSVFDKLQLQHKSGISMPDQVINAIAAQMGLKAKKGTTLFSQIALRLGVQVPATQDEKNDAGIWGRIAQKMGANPTSKPTAAQTKNIKDVGMSIYNLNRDQLTSLQDKLYQAGFYGADYVSGTQGSGKSSYTAGQLDQATMYAWGNLLNQTAAENAAGKYENWSNVLTDTLNGTENLGNVFGTGADTSSSKPTVTLATQDQLTNPAIQAFEQELGRKPTNAEIAQLTQQYDQQQQVRGDQLTANDVVAPDASGVDVIPGVPSASDASVNFARNANPVGYLAHGMANAYGLLSNVISNGVTGVSNDQGAATP